MTTITPPRNTEDANARVRAALIADESLTARLGDGVQVASFECPRTYLLMTVVGEMAGDFHDTAAATLDLLKAVGGIDVVAELISANDWAVFTWLPRKPGYADN